MPSKICGIPNLEVAHEVITIARPIIPLSELALGVYCWTDADKGRNFTTHDEARKITDYCRQQGVDTFCLNYAETVDEAVAEYDAVRPTHMQFLGDISVEAMVRVKELRPRLQTVKVIGVVGLESVQEAYEYASSDGVDQLLLDSRSGSIRGGTGRTHNWDVSAQIVAESKKPVWLAGGLNPGNIHEAKSRVKAYGYDVETGVQNSRRQKDPAKIRDFITAIHS